LPCLLGLALSGSGLRGDVPVRRLNDRSWGRFVRYCGEINRLPNPVVHYGIDSDSMERRLRDPCFVNLLTAQLLGKFPSIVDVAPWSDPCCLPDLKRAFR
jgi:hypothetical protein